MTILNDGTGVLVTTAASAPISGDPELLKKIGVQPEPEPESESDSGTAPNLMWTHEQINAWAARQEPPIVFPSVVTTKGEKLNYITDNTSTADARADEE